MLDRIANWEGLDQNVSLEVHSEVGLHCLTRPFRQATSVKFFRTFAVIIKLLFFRMGSLLYTWLPRKVIQTWCPFSWNIKQRLTPSQA